VIRVSICIPAFNEAEVIRDTLQESIEVLADIPGNHEVLVCDDGSADATADIVRELADAHPLIRLLRHDGNRGNPAAQQTLVEAARGEFIFHIGADREWRMGELVPMLERIEEGYDIVIGVRQRKKYSLRRKAVSACFNWLVAAMWGKHFGDLGSIKLARAHLWKQLPFDSKSAFVHAERILIAYTNGARITTIPVEHFSRTSGHSKFANPKEAVRATADLLRFRLSARSRTKIGLEPSEH